ncbi:hypothetical protein G7054_g11063 [Neopestalotiopsis clavispora]|nr:hypothetical protein G7054_g11063 [Neopestalotiopsis clavispora]
MSKLSEAVKALINAPAASPGLTKASAQVKPALARFASNAAEKKVGLPAWITVSVWEKTIDGRERNAKLPRGHDLDIPRRQRTVVITSEDAGAERRADPRGWAQVHLVQRHPTLHQHPGGLLRQPAAGRGLAALADGEATRQLTPQNLEARQRDGLALWDSVYVGFERKLLDKLGQSHPDLPVHILNGHYTNLLSNPPRGEAGGRPDGGVVGRVLTSLVAISCLRTQTGVGPQVISHIFGLRKAYEYGGARAAGEDEVQGGEWLASDEGNLWMLEQIDALASVITGGSGTTFAPGLRAKL